MRKGQVTKVSVESSALTQPRERERSKRVTHVAQTFRARPLLTTALTANLALLSVATEPALAWEHITGDQTVIGPDAAGSGTLGNPYSYGGDLEIGDGAIGGSLSVTAGGTVTDIGGFDVYVGWENDSAITVSGTGSTWRSFGSFFLGMDGGKGTANVSDGGTLSATSFSIGRNLSSSGHVEVDGGTLKTTFYVVIGENGAGSLTLSHGGVLTIQYIDSSSKILLGRYAGSGGALNIGAAAGEAAAAAGTTNAPVIQTGSGTGKVVFNHTDTNYILGAAIQGSTSIEHYAGTTILTGTNTHTGGTTISGGTLQIGNGGTSGSLSGDVTNNATLIFSRGDALTYAGVISGTGSLTKSGAGTLTLTGSNTHTGGTTVSAGTLQIGNGGTSGSLSGNITNNAGLLFNRSDALTYGGMISGTGSLTKSGAGTLTLTGSNTHTGGTTVSAGTLQIGNGGASGSLSGNITNNAALIFNRSDALTYAGDMSGTGALTKSGAGTLTLTGANTHTGGTTVSAGRLVVNGSLGAVTLSGGTLGGSGTIGGFTANSGSTIAPGNSIGTLNVTGNADFAAGSTYEVEVDSAGNADKIVATGGVSIDPNAKVNILAENGTDDGSTYAPSTTYTIITAGSAVNGKFGTVTDNFAFLDAALVYNPKDVTLTLTRNAAPFASVGRTPNQTAVANGVSSLTAGNAVYNAVVGLSADGARTAFDRLSGEIHPSINGQLLEDSHLVRDAALARMLAPEEATGAWAQAYGNWEQSQGDGNASEMNRLLGETLFGADAIVWDGWRTGVVAGYAKTGFSAGNVASEADADSYILGGYASGAFGPVGVRFGTSYALHDVSTSRTAKAGGFSNELTADYFAGTAQVFGEVGYRFETPQGHFEPYAGLALVNQHSAGFSENGGAAALTASSASQTMGVTSIGVRGMQELSVGDDVTAALTGGVEWRHVIGDTSAQSAMNFAGSDAFTIAGTPMERDTFQLEAGLNLEFCRQRCVHHRRNPHGA